MIKVALVHDYLNEFGGAERVLLALSEIWPEAPIYTAFCRKDSESYRRFKGKKIITSWAQKIPWFKEKLYSPLRFLAPKIWGSFEKQLADHDIVISSSSWYITKGFNDICYCHTPPRWLYGYKTSQDWQRFWLVRVYATIVGYFMRHYDFQQAQKVKYFIANSKETKRRIEKFYRRESVVIYPPIDLPHFAKGYAGAKRDYYLIVSRLVGSKGIELGVEAAKKLGFKLKIVGEGPLKIEPEKNIQVLGQVNDQELGRLYSGAKAFLALAKDEDFGITPLEAMACGTPVIAFNGGGYKETVVDPTSRKASRGAGATGLFFDDYSVKSLMQAIKKFEKMKFKQEDCFEQAKKFNKERFKQEIREFVESKLK
ncbi:MAG: glycosyltransferase [Candidatus Beckwithbacteria bacterium]|nr:glycosyltransferase [Candidatus Beckwithbacteria bacterium]